MFEINLLKYLSFVIEFSQVAQSIFLTKGVRIKAPNLSLLSEIASEKCIFAASLYWINFER